MLRKLYREYVREANELGLTAATLEKFLSEMGAQEMSIKEWLKNRPEKVEKIGTERTGCELFFDEWQDGGLTMASDLYVQYVAWCEKVGKKPVSSNRLGRAATARFGKSKSIYIEGVSAKRYRISRKVSML